MASVGKTVKVIATGVGFVVVVVALMAVLIGVFEPKLSGQRAEGPALPAADTAQLVPVRQVALPAEESAVGTIRAVHETALASKLLAKVVEVNAVAGQEVIEGDVLVRLDDEDLRARLQQAEAALQAAEATRDQAQIEYDRLVGLRAQNAAPPIEVQRAESALKSADAQVERAEQARQESATILSYATLEAPLTGIVVDKQVEVGDTVSPGQVLVRLYNPKRMQLVASVRESLAHQLQVGQEIGVRVDAMQERCLGRISEIVPKAESTSRSFDVKVTGPCPPGIYSGMFGRLLVPLGTEQVVVVPRDAVRQVGQLSMVQVASNGRLHRRVVQLGRELDGDVEVLSGLQVGEEVALP